MTTGAAIAGKYRLLRPLGKGSMGEVWAALHINLGREVALKLIYEGSPELAARLKREAQACGRLEHPNIVRVYDFGETDGGDPFLVMEMLAGETLADRLARRQRLPLGEAVSIALDVARALRAAHEAGVIHRDLKPANVFLCQRPEGETVKVLDFGVSKILSVDDMSVTTTGALVGSPAYMSPEQARALREIDPRADVWSAGVLLFEMLTGQRPFPSPTVVGVVADILAGPIPTLASVLPGVDPRVDQVVGRCLTRALDQRMPSAAALIEALAPVLGPPPAPASFSGDAAPSAPVDVGLRAGADSMDVHLDPSDPDEASTIALPSRLIVPRVSDPVTESNPEAETAVMAGRAVLAFRAQARAGMPPPPPGRAPPPPPPPPSPSSPSSASPSSHLPPRAPPDSDELPTAVQPSGRAPENVVPTRILAHPFAARVEPAVARAPQFGPPPAMPEPPRAPVPWDLGPSRQQTAPTQPGFDPAATRITLPPGWQASRNDARRVLWITAIAGLVVGLVVFVGLSLLR